MAIGEVFIGALITVLFEKLASGDLIRLAQTSGIDSQLNKLRANLALIRAVFEDAGQKHITDTSVQLWLNQLQHLAYEIDDLLDDLATEAMRRRLNQESHASTSTSKISKFIPTKFHAVKYGLKMSSKLNEITTKLLDHVKEKELLGLNDNVERPNKGSIRLQETSLVDESKIIGRESDKEGLRRMLLGGEFSSSQTQNVNIVSIVGLGGIGKTTLAQLLYNDKEVQSHFELMSWVCVSDEFDVFKISKAIFKDVGGVASKFETLNQLQVALKEKLSNKRFLLVLDDVWNENYNEWELFQRPFYVGATGSKILVTTRKTTVASVMTSVKAYYLELLSDEDALSLFSQYALGKPNFDSRPTIKLCGEGIVKKCGGLPLALRTLGWVLRTKTNDEEWEVLLNSELWNSHNGSEILPALKLSYHDLPKHLKQLFVYCCLFPKDYMFDKNELVLLWMAEGFLYEPIGNKSMESFGVECFEELVSRSFFQHSNNKKSRYTMHDLIHDLATSVAGKFFFLLDDKMDVFDKNEALDKVHHLSFIRERFGPYNKIKALQRAKRLRTFLPMSVTGLKSWETFFISNKVLAELLPQLKFLRVLNLANYNFTKVPESIGRFKHMRYLNFSKTKITCLPEEVGELHNLQSLLLSHCRELSSLPNSIVKLINLRHLDITDTPQLNKMPLGLGGLTCLQTLPRFVIVDSEYRISDLKGLLYLQGQFSIEGLHQVKDVIHAKEANLQQKKGICDLRMKWIDVFDDCRNGNSEYEVLESLRPFKKLTSLEIVYYGATEFPSWVGDPSFDSLTQLTLRGCRNCTSLPTLGHLPSLQKLFVESMDGLKSLGSELLGYSSSSHGVAFPSLEVMKFQDMMGWEEWSASGADKAGMFPCLREISIINCPKLDVVAVELIPSLQHLSVHGCSLAVLRSMVCVSSSIARLKMHNIKGLTQLHGEVLEHLKAVEDLSISTCDELTFLWESEAAACDILQKLEILNVSFCPSLVSLGEKVEHLKIDMKSLREMTIRDCKMLKSYNCPNNVEKLIIMDCRSLTSLAFPSIDHHPSTLKSLYIYYCEMLKSCNCPNTVEKLRISCCPSLTSLAFPTIDHHPSTLKSLYIFYYDNVEVSWFLNKFLASLEFLSILSSKNLRLFPEGCLCHLTNLKIVGCDEIESIPDNGYGFLPSRCLRSLEIKCCKNLKSFPHEHLQSLTSLEEINITFCPRLDDSFPCGLWPSNLSRLSIGGLKKPISEWGVQNFPTSLVTLSLYGDENSGVVSFAAKAEENISSLSFLLPSSLTSLHIRDFMELESVSEGLQHLTCLQHLHIYGCKKLRDLPETLLPSLLSLRVSGCSPKLTKRCRKGKYLPIISQIPYLDILD